MKYKISKKEKNIVVLELTLDANEWKAEIDEAYNKNKGKYSIEGFRKGKAPRKVIESMYGPTVFYEEALTEAFSKNYTVILDKEKDIEPIDAPALSVKSLDEKGVVIEAEIPVMPEVKLGKYTGLNINIAPKEVTDKQVKDELKRVQEEQARLVEVTGEKVKKGNIVNLNFEGFIDGKPFDGGKAENYDLEIGSKSFIDTFEDQLVDMAVDEEKDVNVTFPENYQVEELKGKPAVFKVKINTIKKKELPELNDAFASDVSEFETLEDYKKHIKEHLQEHAIENAKIETENKIIEAIIKDMEVDIPDVMIESELDNMMKDMEYRLMYQGLKLEDYARYLNTTVEDMRKQYKSEAVKSIKVRLAMQEILKKEKLDVSQEEVNAKIKELAKNAKKTIKEYKETMNAQSLNYIKNDILMSKLLSFLTENNK